MKQRKRQTVKNAPGWHHVDHFTKLNTPSEGGGMEREEGGRTPTKSQEVKSSHVIYKEGRGVGVEVGNSLGYLATLVQRHVHQAQPGRRKQPGRILN